LTRGGHFFFFWLFSLFFLAGGDQKNVFLGPFLFFMPTLPWGGRKDSGFPTHGGGGVFSPPPPPPFGWGGSLGPGLPVPVVFSKILRSGQHPSIPPLPLQFSGGPAGRFPPKLFSSTVFPGPTPPGLFMFCFPLETRVSTVHFICGGRGGRGTQSLSFLFPRHGGMPGGGFLRGDLRGVHSVLCHGAASEKNQKPFRGCKFPQIF